MKTYSIFSGLAAAILGMAATACGQATSQKEEGFPKDFNSRDDVAKVAYVMEHAAPDSVARFICDAALGRVEGAKIDSLTVAVGYAYQAYIDPKEKNDSNLRVFSEVLDDYPNHLSLPDKMQLYALLGKTDAHRLGYQLGLEYVQQIRDKRLTVEQVKADIEALRKACAADTATFVRFTKGFQTVLKVDHGQDLPEAIYEAFSE